MFFFSNINNLIWNYVQETFKRSMCILCSSHSVPNHTNRLADYIKLPHSGTSNKDNVQLSVISCIALNWNLCFHMFPKVYGQVDWPWFPSKQRVILICKWLNSDDSVISWAGDPKNDVHKMLGLWAHWDRV